VTAKALETQAVTAANYLGTGFDGILPLLVDSFDIIGKVITPCLKMAYKSKITFDLEV
jgi:hypothetical protein